MTDWFYDMNDDDRAAIIRLKDGDIGGLQVLVERYQGQAVRAAYLITLDRETAEDIVQEAFLRVFRRIGQFDINRPFGPWFSRSVVNDAIKAASRHRSISLDNFTDDLPDHHTLDPADWVEWDETCKAIYGALEKLSPPQRAAIVLRYYLGMSEIAIARELNCAPGTVKWRLHAARHQLGLWLNWIRS